MADLSTARTRLGVGGAVRKTGDFTLKASGPSLRTVYTQTWAKPGVGGGVRRNGSFSGKSLTSVFDLSASDSLLLTLSEDPVDSQGIASGDTLRLTLSEVSAVFRFVAVVDALNLFAGETIALGIVGVTNITPSDTLSLSLSESVVVDVSLAVTDALSLSVTDSGSVAFALQAIDVTDTLSLAASDASFLNVFTGILSVATSDDLRLGMVDIGVMAVVVPVEPVARMSFTLRQKRMRFTLQ